jgi:DNA-binding CsgD family transcriptional regulator
MTEDSIYTGRLPRSVAAAAEAVLVGCREAQEVKRIFKHSHVPMVMVDGSRRYVEANRPARLVFRLSLDEFRALTVDDLTPATGMRAMEQAWTRLLATGSFAGRYQVAGRDGSRFEIVICGLTHVLPGLHLTVFAPADWPEHELEPIDDGRGDAFASLTSREIEVLALAADGRSGPDLAHELVLSPGTVNTHFKNIYAKLDVRTRAAAVAKAMRLGLIA